MELPRRRVWPLESPERFDRGISPERLLRVIAREIASRDCEIALEDLCQKTLACNLIRILALEDSCRTRERVVKRPKFVLQVACPRLEARGPGLEFLGSPQLEKNNFSVQKYTRSALPHLEKGGRRNLQQRSMQRTAQRA